MAATARPSGARAPEEATPAYNSGNLIRLHVVAPGDDPQSQRLKFAVRDSVLEETGRLLQSADDANQATRILRANLWQIEAAAEEAVARSGTSHRVQAALGTFSFPGVSYGNALLPAGDYLALKVAIGPALGANWWCVLFPPLCPVDLERTRILEVAATAGDSSAPGWQSNAGGRLLTLELAMHAGPLAGAVARREATFYQIATGSPRLTLAQLTWEIPAWACRLLKWPQLQQARSR
ncbi:MAG: stage II sporulation protein R [Bacillota bacterium]|jgi:stage II sporulation protein R